MKRIVLISLIIILAATVLTACGSRGGDDDGADLTAPASVIVTPSRTVALADGSSEVTILADVKKADGSAVADGTVVTFSTSGSAGANLSASTAASAGGLASVTLTHGPVTGKNNETVVVTAAVGDKSGQKPVKFINQPASVDVSLALNQPVTNLAALQLKLNNTAGASFDNTAQPVVAINAALGSAMAANFNANTNNIGLINAAGFSTSTAPIIKATFAVVLGAGLPAFSVDQTAGTFAATDKDGNATEPQISAANIVVATVFDTE